MNTATFDFVTSFQPFGRMSKSLAPLSRGASRRSFPAIATDLDLAYGQTTARVRLADPRRRLPRRRATGRPIAHC